MDKGLGHPLGKQPEGEGNSEWAVAGRNGKYQLEMQIHTTLRDNFSPIR